MGVVTLAIALTVSFISAITLLGISAENYEHGAQIVLIYLGGIIGTPIILYFYLPVLAEVNTMSVYEVILRSIGSLSIIDNVERFCRVRL